MTFVAVSLTTTCPRPADALAEEARRTEVLDVARDVLINDGLDQFVMRHIAERAGMKLGNLQYYFATRDELLDAVIRAEFDRDLATLRRAIVATAEPAHELAEVARRLVENWCTGGSNVFMTLALLAYHHQRFARLNAEIYETFYAELGSLIRRIDPTADDREVTARAHLITSLLDGVSVQTHAALDHDDAACRQLLARATTLVSAIAMGGRCG